MKYTNVTNPVWADLQHSGINCVVAFTDENVGVVAFTANPLDTVNPSSKQIFDECVAGEFGEIATYIPPPEPTYQEQRAAAYPPVADYLDGVVKGDAVQVQAYVDACLAVKARYPKP